MHVIMLLVGVLLLRLIPITVGGYIPGNLRLFSLFVPDLTFQVDHDMFFWNLIQSDPAAGRLMVAFAIIGVVFAYLGKRARKVSKA